MPSFQLLSVTDFSVAECCDTNTVVQYNEWLVGVVHCRWTRVIWRCVSRRRCSTRSPVSARRRRRGKDVQSARDVVEPEPASRKASWVNRTWSNSVPLTSVSPRWSSTPRTCSRSDAVLLLDWNDYFYATGFRKTIWFADEKLFTVSVSSYPGVWSQLHRKPETQPSCKLCVLMHCLAEMCKSQSIHTSAWTWSFSGLFWGWNSETSTVYHQ